MRRFVLGAMLIAFAAGSSEAEAGGPGAEMRSGIRLAFGGGWAGTRMTSINDGYIDQFARPFGDFEDHLTGGPDVVVEGTYSRTPRFAIGLAIAYLRASIDGESVFEVIDENGDVIDTRPIDNGLDTRLIVPEVIGTYALLRGNPELSVVLGAGWGFGQATRTTEVVLEPGDAFSGLPTMRTRWTAGGMSARVGTRAALAVVGPLSVGVEASYRYATTGDLRSGSEDTWQVQTGGNPQNMDLDFSGPALRLLLIVSL